MRKDRDRTALKLKRDQMVGGYPKKAGDWIAVPKAKAEKYIARGIADEGPDWTENVGGDKHVLMVARHGCSRVAKETCALKALGYRVDCVAAGIPQLVNSFDVVKVVPEAEMASVIAASGAAIVHVHNEPDRLMRYADEGARGRPIIYDCHDIEWYRFGHVTDDETFAFDRADGIVHTSKLYAGSAHRLGHRKRCPEAIVHSCPMRAWKPKEPDEDDRHHVVYEGASFPNSVASNRFRDHVEVARAFADAGVRFEMFVNLDGLATYPHARLMLPYMQMIARLPSYKWGFLGMDVDTSKWRVAVPNKLFEYLMCGLPIIAVNARAVETYMDGKAGIYAKSMEVAIARMKDRRTDWRALHTEAVKAARYMDDEIPELVALYGQVLGTFSCPECDGKAFKNQADLNAHIRMKHGREPEGGK